MKCILRKIKKKIFSVQEVGLFIHANISVVHPSPIQHALHKCIRFSISLLIEMNIRKEFLRYL